MKAPVSVLAGSKVRWTPAFRRLKACKQLSILKAALRAIQNRHALERTGKAG
jgi:hypothetical protein